ncbi:4867_t:CDS:2 [Racocetra fulgida]|uniref:4867_t:CDS:1 n=1 Tax=Racocetra fulgida TaxID=60492 RepID=A0A9N9AK50_9GLOM|nr:4867_t:CDS:2 [Racocetra fulgida]
MISLIYSHIKINTDDLADDLAEDLTEDLVKDLAEDQQFLEYEDQRSEDDFFLNKDNEVAEIISDLLLNNDSEASKIAQTMERYIQIIDEPIATEGAKENNQEQESDDDDKEPPPPPVTAKEVHNAIQTILHYEEQTNSELNLEPNELEFLRKLNNNYRHAHKKSKKQMQITSFFISEYL